MSTIGLADRIDLTRGDGPPSHKEWTASLHSGHLALPAGNPGSERAFKEWCGNQQRADAEDKKEDQVGLDGSEATILQKNCLESMAALRTAAMGSAELRGPREIEQVEIESAGRGSCGSPTPRSGTARVGLSSRFRHSGT